MTFSGPSTSASAANEPKADEPKVEEFGIPEDLKPYVSRIGFQIDFTHGRDSNPVEARLWAIAHPVADNKEFDRWLRDNACTACDRRITHQEKVTIVPEIRDLKDGDDNVHGQTPVWPSDQQFLEGADSLGARKAAYAHLLAKVRTLVTAYELEMRLLSVSDETIRKIVLELLTIMKAPTTPNDHYFESEVGQQTVKLLQPILDRKVEPKKEKKLGDFNREVIALSKRMSEAAGAPVILNPQIALSPGQVHPMLEEMLMGIGGRGFMRGGGPGW